MNNYSLREKEILDNLFSFFSLIEIKDSEEAAKNETKESSFSSSIYISASLQNDSFLTYNYKTVDLMSALQCTEEDAEEIIATNYQTLKPTDRLKMQLYKRNDTIQNYEEMNNYYRELSGLPKQFEDPLTINNGRKVTELSNNEINFIYKDEINELIRKNPNKKYLRRLGDKKINTVFARTSRNFGILYYPEGIFESDVIKKILDYYYENLNYVESVIYSKAFMHYEYYNNFIIFLLVVMTMQRFLLDQLDRGIRREFIDEESMKNFFDSYNLPYWTNLPTKYKKRLIKNMNKLFMYKGTDKVIIDIVNLLGFENVEIFKHYLVKVVEEDTDGQKYEDLKFVGIKVNTKNIPNTIKKSVNEDSYDNVTMADPFWSPDGSDSELKQKLLESEFNYIATKYMSINTMYNVTQLTTEVCYFFQLLNKLEREQKLDLYFYSNDIKANGEAIHLYDAIVGIYYLVCKKLNFVDTIITSNTAMASIFGFNFDSDIETLRSILEQENLDLSTEFLKTYSIPAGLMKKKDIIDLYFNNITFKSRIERAMLQCDDIKTYKTLKKIHSYNSYCENNKEQFKRADGTYYPTYLSYLKDRDKSFAEYIETESNTKEDLYTTLNNIFYALESFLDSEKFKFVFIGLSTLSSEVITQYLKQLLEFFKSYTVELNNINSFFILDDKFNNTIKLISEIKMTSNLDISSVDRNFVDLFDDIFNLITYDKEDNLNLEALERRLVTLGNEDKLIFKDLIQEIFVSSKQRDYLIVDDDIKLGNILKNLQTIELEDVMNRYINLIQKQDLNMKEKYFVKSFQMLIDRGFLDMDDILIITNKISNNEKITITDFIRYAKTHKLNEDMNLCEKVKLNADENYVNKVIKDDTVDVCSTIKSLSSSVKLKEQIFIFRNRDPLKH